MSAYMTFACAVDNFYRTLREIADSFEAQCDQPNPSPTLPSTCARAACEAGEEAIKQFRAEHPHPFGFEPPNSCERLDRH